MSKTKVLFLCTHNSARSQMAEGLLRFLYGDEYEVFSAGTNPTQVNPLAIKVMDEIGIDISGQYSKNLDVFKDVDIDLVVSVCRSGSKINCAICHNSCRRDTGRCGFRGLRFPKRYAGPSQCLCWWECPYHERRRIWLCICRVQRRNSLWVLRGLT